MSPITKRFLKLIQGKKKAIEKKYSVVRIGIFGSCVRNEEDGDSDIDVLVEFGKKTFDNYMELKIFLEDNLGRPVDLVIIDALKPALRNEILKEVKYAA